MNDSGKPTTALLLPCPFKLTTKQFIKSATLPIISYCYHRNEKSDRVLLQFFHYLYLYLTQELDGIRPRRRRRTGSRKPWETEILDRTGVQKMRRVQTRGQTFDLLKTRKYNKTLVYQEGKIRCACGACTVPLGATSYFWNDW